jgi:hypothetical protein
MATQPQPTTKTGTVPVTADNFIRAETDVVFAGMCQQGGFGKFHHYREVIPIENHTAPLSSTQRDSRRYLGVSRREASSLIN